MHYQTTAPKLGELFWIITDISVVVDLPLFYAAKNSGLCTVSTNSRIVPHVMPGDTTSASVNINTIENPLLRAQTGELAVFKKQELGAPPVWIVCPRTVTVVFPIPVLHVNLCENIRPRPLNMVYNTNHIPEYCWHVLQVWSELAVIHANHRFSYDHWSRALCAGRPTLKGNFC